MISRHVLQAVAERLTVQGDCPADPACRFDGGDRCVAPSENLEERVSAAKESLEGQGGMVVHNVTERSPFPCNDFIVVEFIEPD